MQLTLKCEIQYPYVLMQYYNLRFENLRMFIYNDLFDSGFLLNETIFIFYSCEPLI